MNDIGVQGCPFASLHPRKLNTKKCKTIEPTTKSANALENVFRKKVIRYTQIDAPFWRYFLEGFLVLRVHL